MTNTNRPVLREVLTLADGGQVCIDYADCPHLPPSAPFVVFLHTITGSARSLLGCQDLPDLLCRETSHYMRAATRRGWRSAVFNRRAHAGLRLTAPRSGFSRLRAWIFTFVYLVCRICDECSATYEVRFENQSYLENHILTNIGPHLVLF